MNGDHILIYAHHAQSEQAPAYVLASLERFLEVADRAVLVAAGVDRLLIPDSMGHRVCVLCRPNRGWDFASYRDGLASLDPLPARVTLCNDSVYGPLFPLAPVFDRMAGHDADVWGMTASSELHWHLQSYFLSFGAAALKHPAFRDFWSSVSDEAERREVIRDGEVGLSQQLLKAGLRLQPLYVLSADPSGDGSMQSPAEFVTRGLRSVRRRWMQADFYRDLREVLLKGSRPGRNPSLEDWSQLVAEQGLPLVKRSVLRETPEALTELEAGLAASQQRPCEDVLHALRSDLNA